jgi:DNA uptake protein ComE-like DNA-binding protein
MWIMLFLAGLVLVLTQMIRVEANCSANAQAEAEAAAIEQGAIEYVLANVDGLHGKLPDPNNVPCEGVILGKGAFWILQQSTNASNDDRTYRYGIGDEGGKLNLNTATIMMLSMLPNMTVDLPTAITDWRNPSGGTDNSYYLLLPDPYESKNGPLETVEELLWIKGASIELLFGEDTNRNGVLDRNEDTNGDGKLDRGIYNLVTVYSREGSRVGLINVNTAPREVLLCLPGLNDSDVDALLAKRAQNTTGSTDTIWVANALSDEKVAAIRNLITGNSFQFSADIVSVAGNGRAFRRCRIVVDAHNSPPKVIYRQDWTGLGWPLSPQILADLRAGNPLEQIVPIQQPRGMTL